MKKYTLSLLCCLFMVSNLFSQDPQWLVDDQTGGTFIPGPIVYLHDVAHPDLNFDTRAKNDVLIIYQDGSFYSSRPSYGTSGTIHPFRGSQGSANYQVDGTKTIQYLYFTNVYEGDDPNAEARSSSTGGSYLPVSVNEGSVMDLNHDVVPRKDVTLSLKIDDLTKEECDSLTVCYNMLLNGGSVVSYDYLDLEYSLNGLPYFTGLSSNHSLNGDCITVSTPSNYLHVNFRVKNTLNNIQNLDDIEAYFEVTGACLSTKYEVKDSIRRSHDPNFIEVTKVCLDQQTNEESMNFHVQFENDGNEVVDDVALNFTLPSFLDPSTLCVTNWWAGGDSGDCIPHRANGQEIKFCYPSSVDLSAADPNPISQTNPANPPYGNTVGYVEFCAKKKPDTSYASVDLQQINISFNSSTDFDGDCYPINDFIDPQDFLKEGASLSNQSRVIYACACFCKSCGTCPTNPPLWPWVALGILAIALIAIKMLKGQ